MHKQLTWTDRLNIEKYLKAGMKPVEIAAKMRVHHSTIYRELKRGTYTHTNSDLTTEERYSPDIAEECRKINATAKGVRGLKIGNDRELSDFIETKIIKDKFSPAAVVAWIENKGLQFSTTLCEKTIYNYIHKGVFLRLTVEHLPEKGERKRQYKKIRAARAPRGESIEKRPQEINERSTFGHWEMDCVEGKKSTKKTLLVLSERLTRQEILLLMPDQTTASVVAALDRLERRFGKTFPAIFKSITVDNGTEFSNCTGMERSRLKKNTRRTRVYYCHPYSAYERGTNENTNKLVRRHFPKGTDFRKITAATVKNVELWINEYPRGILDFKSSGFMFERYVVNVA